MSNTGADAANAQSESRSVSDLHDLRLTSLLFDLVEAHGRVKAAETLGVSYGALARAVDTGRLSGRMRDAWTHHNTEAAGYGDAAEQNDAGGRPRSERLAIPGNETLGTRLGLAAIGVQCVAFPDCYVFPVSSL